MNEIYKTKAKKFKTKKSLGQNFLCDSEVLDFISNFASCDDEILEIGSGLGFLTEKLINKAKLVKTLEVDKSAIRYLNKKFSNIKNLEIIEKDILKTNIDELKFQNEKIKIIANIPYYITTPIIAHLLGEIDDFHNKNRKRISKMLLMVQYEVAKRIVANENSSNKEYGLLSFLSQMWADVEIVKKVDKTSFEPSPKVDSALVLFTINDNPKCQITPLFKKTLFALFNQRRKTAKNTLSNAGFKNIEAAMEKCNIDKNTRGEKLSFEQIKNLSIALEEYNNEFN